LAFSNGGKEVELARESALFETGDVEAIAVLETRAVGLKGRETKILATCAMPLPLSWLAKAGLGRDRLGKVEIRDGRILTRIERVYARKTIAAREEIPQGARAREAIAALFLDRRIFPHLLAEVEDRLEAATLAQDLERHGLSPWPDRPGEAWRLEDRDVRSWVLHRLESLGLETAEDLDLLEGRDLLPPQLPDTVSGPLDGLYPRRLSLPTGRYRVAYELVSRTATLSPDPEKAGIKEPPPLAYLPRWRGFGICYRKGDQVRTLRPAHP
jgi:hypothetical protein